MKNEINSPFTISTIIESLQDIFAIDEVEPPVLGEIPDGKGYIYVPTERFSADAVFYARLIENINMFTSPYFQVPNDITEFATQINDYACELEKSFGLDFSVSDLNHWFIKKVKYCDLNTDIISDPLFRNDEYLPHMLEAIDIIYRAMSKDTSLYAGLVSKGSMVRNEINSWLEDEKVIDSNQKLI